MVRTAIRTDFTVFVSSMRPPGVSAFRSGLLFPASEVSVVFSPRLDPAGAVGTMLLLPEGRAGLQVIHEVVAGLESGAAVARSGGDEDHRLARSDPADPVQDHQVDQAEARAGSLGDLSDAGFGEAGVGFEFER